jgi:glucose-6-phosphate isomerase
MIMSDLTQLPAWRALADHLDHMAHTSISGLFAQDDRRFERFSMEAAGIFVDYSKNLIRTETLGLNRSGHESS